MQTEHQPYRADPSAMRESADWAERYRGDVRRVVNDNPTGALLSAFGAGFGIGLAIGVSIVLAEEPPKRRRRDDFRDRAEELGHRVMESMQDYIPEAISRRMS